MLLASTGLNLNSRSPSALDQVNSDPVSEILEQLSAQGISQVIGVGYAHSLTTHIMEGQIVLASSAVDLDGPSMNLSYPNRDLFEEFRRQAARRCLSIRRARILTADPLDEEDFEEKTWQYRQFDTEVVHPDTFTFLTEAKRLGLPAIFSCVIATPFFRPGRTTRLNPIAREMAELQDLVKSILKPDATNIDRLETRTMSILFD